MKVAGRLEVVRVGYDPADEVCSETAMAFPVHEDTKGTHCSGSNVIVYEGNLTPTREDPAIGTVGCDKCGKMFKGVIIEIP